MARKKKNPALTSTGLPADYPAFLDALKNRVRQAQTKAMLSVNRDLIQLYWDIGRLILERQEQAGWCQSIIDRIAGDIQKAFPAIRGFSPSNVSRMRAFCLAYRRDLKDSARPVPKLGGKKSAQPVPKSGTRKIAQPVRHLPQAGPPQEVAGLPWGHNVVLLFKLKDPAQSFTPEDAGKMNFYLSTVDAQMRHAEDAPSIGLILCKTNDRLIAEYALRDIAKPIGVAEWQTKLVQSLPKSLQGSLPSIEQIEAEFGAEESP